MFAKISALELVNTILRKMVPNPLRGKVFYLVFNTLRGQDTFSQGFNFAVG